ncbi:MAG: 50S ribosomal protein L23 [Bdellovibrionales bacterium]|jgi:large subunit ribosomal protein L23
MYQIIKKPLVSEKNSMLAENGVYVFDVEKAATKPEIKNAIEKLFRVKVIAVRTVIGRSRATKGRSGMSAVKYNKKAMVRLAKGDKIALFEGT